jgi:hypothetical protein
LIQEIGGMRVVDQNSLIAHIVQLKRTPDYGSGDRSLNLFEGTKDDTKRRMTDVERRVVRVHTKDRYSILIVLM